jgi:coenzyme F420 hydrogenase subunit beta
MNSKRTLHILPEQNSLRGSSPFLSLQSWELPFDTGQPRALRSLSRIIDNGLCHRCGSCVGICPTGVLAVETDGYPTIKSLSACTDCDLCVKVCPGDEFEFHRHHQSMYNESGDITSTHGHFIDSTIAYATHPGLREGSTSGGLVTAILLSLLKRGEIDGAVVIASDPEKLWRGKPIVARSESEILGAVKSKYAISPTNSVFTELREIPGRYALVGLPCQIHGYVKAAELDQRLKERVVLTIGLFCHAAVEHEGYEVIWDSLGEKGKRAKRFISRVGKHPGAPHIELDDGSLYPVYFGEKQGYRPSSMEIINILYRLYSPSRCLTCFDSSSEFADIAIGDPWMAPPEDDVDFYKGWSFALIRSERARKVYQEVLAAGDIVSKKVTRKEALECNTLMGNEKRWRAFRIIETQRRQGKPIPSYGKDGFLSPEHSFKQFLKTEINMLTHALCYLPSLRAPVMRFMLGNGGYYLLWLNSLRRRFRFWYRDTKARVMREILGRR